MFQSNGISLHSYYNEGQGYGIQVWDRSHQRIFGIGFGDRIISKIAYDIAPKHGLKLLSTFDLNEDTEYTGDEIKQLQTEVLFLLENIQFNHGEIVVLGYILTLTTLAQYIPDSIIRTSGN